MIHPERIPLNEAEEAAVEKLIAEQGEALSGFTRRDPGNTGPLLVHASDDTTWEISEDGKRKKVS